MQRQDKNGGNHVLIIGLTGGIGCGKSTVAKCFAQLEAPIIDADKIAHELLQPETIYYRKILARFGNEYLTTQKTINRKKLRQKIFSDKKERAWLESFLHPQIHASMKKQASKLKAPYCIMVIPLLFETKLPIKIDEILVIDCPLKIQIQRIVKRDDINTKQAQAIIKTQVTRKTRLQQADNIIYNSGSLEDLKKEVKKLHKHYLSQAVL